MLNEETEAPSSRSQDWRATVYVAWTELLLPPEALTSQLT